MLIGEGPKGPEIEVPVPDGAAEGSVEINNAYAALILEGVDPSSLDHQTVALANRANDFVPGPDGELVRVRPDKWG